MDDNLKAKRMEELGKAFMSCINDDDDIMLVIGTMAVTSTCLIRAVDKQPDMAIAANSFLTVFNEALHCKLDKEGD